MDMRFGPTTEDGAFRKASRCLRDCFGVVLLLGLLSGCEPASSDNQNSKPSSAATNSGPTVSSSTTGSSATMLEIPAGRFVMGDPDEVDAAPHEVNISAFYLDKYLVTQDQFQTLMHDNPSRWKGGNNPVEQVRWSDAVRFCNKRSEAEGLKPCYDLQTWKCDFDADGYRLPTEAEFEYACRAGTGTPYLSGNTSAKLGDFAWFEKNSGGHPHAIGQKQPNAWGLYDMCGNLWEWCNDFYQVDYYASAARQDPKGPLEGKTKVVRGGSWRAPAENCRPGYRYNENPGYADVCFGYDIYGFRCARKMAGKR